uniref:Uncharacterized protein n=1 Tax=viral metagenome TaxID=1070528 RepID=A0A6M3L9M9_9ZZZZ
MAGEQRQDVGQEMADEVAEGATVGYVTPDIPAADHGTAKESDKREEGDEGGVTIDTIADLQGLSEDDLIDLAEAEGVKYDGLARDDVEQALAEVYGIEEGGAEDKGPRTTKEFEVERENLLRTNAALRTRAQLVDAIVANPEEVLGELAERYGLQVVRPGQASETKELDLSYKEGEDVAAYMKRVVTTAVSDAVSKVTGGKPGAKGKAPLQSSSEELAMKARIEVARAYLDENHPDWHTYEVKMRDLVVQDPSLLSAPWKLYSKASGKAKSRDEALGKKLKGRQAGKMRSGEQSRGVLKLRVGAKGRKTTFNEAWDLAMRQKQGGR